MSYVVVLIVGIVLGMLFAYGMEALIEDECDCYQDTETEWAHGTTHPVFMDGEPVELSKIQRQMIESTKQSYLDEEGSG